MQLRADWIFVFFYVTKLGRVIKSMAWCPCACESRPQDNRNMKSTWLCWWFIFWSTCVNGNGRLHDDANRMLNIKKKKKRFSSSLSDYGTPFFIPLPWQRIDPVRIKKRRKRRKVLIEFDLVFLSLFSERTRRRAKAIHLGSISSGRVTHKAAPAQRSSWQCISPGHLTYSFHYLINPSSGSSNGGSGGSNRGPGIVNQLMGCWWRHRMLIISPLSSDVQEEDNGRVAKFRQI